MEWVEGTSLKQALPLLPHDASGGLTTQMVAAVGNAVLRALLMTQGLVNPVIHRDLSPANIMFRTTSRTLEQQIADCSFDPCLIDMGSATMALGDDTITRRADIWRFATPAYAAPEMLTQDIEGIAALRRSPALTSMRFRAFCTSSTAVANRLTLSRRTPLQPARSIS